MKAVIFDMDGVMFDTERLIIEGLDVVGEQLGMGKLGYVGMRTLGLNAQGTRQEWKREFGEKFDESVILKEVHNYVYSYYDKYKVPVKKGLYELLTFISENNLKTAIASSSARQSVMHHLIDAGVEDYFPVVICGDMVEHSKPEPEIYLKACEKLHCAPRECYVLEDSKNGIISGHRAGCNVIMIPDLWQPTLEINQILHAKCQDLEEVKELIQNEMEL